MSLYWVTLPTGGWFDVLVGHRQCDVVLISNSVFFALVLVLVVMWSLCLVIYLTQSLFSRSWCDEFKTCGLWCYFIMLIMQLFLPLAIGIMVLLLVSSSVVLSCLVLLLEFWSYLCHKSHSTICGLFDFCKCVSCADITTVLHMT